MKERHTVVERGGGGYTDNSKLINITYTFLCSANPLDFCPTMSTLF